jgi:hypothetical protein
LALPLLSNSATWSQLGQYYDTRYETVTKVFNPELKPHSSSEPKLYQKEKITTKIADDVPFVGITNCTFESISDITGGIIALKGTSLTIQDTKFTKIEGTYSIVLEYCDGILISDTEFSDFKNAGGIRLIGCNDISIYSSTFKGFDNREEVEDQIDNSPIIFQMCSGIVVSSTVFSDNNCNGSLMVISNSGRAIINKCNFTKNFIICPGSIFVCSSDFINIQNSIFSDNTGGTHSVAIFSKNSVIGIYHILFSRNSITPVSNVPNPVLSISNHLLAMVATIISPTDVDSVRYPVNVNNLFFENTAAIPEGNDHFVFMAKELVIDTPKIGYDGIIETTSTEENSFHLGSSYEFIFTGRKNVAFNHVVPEPFIPVIDYGIQPLLPEIRQKKISYTYSLTSIVNVNAPLAFITIDGCTFEDATIINSEKEDETSFIHIDMNFGGSVSISNSIFEDNTVSSSLMDIINAKHCSISECTFSFNTAKHSAGALIVNTEAVRICGNLFEKNNAIVHGAVALYNVSDALFIQNVFKKNTGFFGCSSLIIHDSNVRINDTVFLKNNLDFKCDNLEEGYFYINESKFIMDHAAIPGVTTPRKIAIAVSAYGQSTLTLQNVAFSDSENEAEVLNSTYINLTAIDGYAEPSVRITGSATCTDTTNLAFVGEWNVPFVDDECDISPYFRHIESYAPVYTKIIRYSIKKVGERYQIQPYDIMGVTYDPISRADCPVSIDEYIPFEPDYPEPEKPKAQIEKSSNTAMTIIILFICFTIIILVCTAIYFCRQPPEDRLDDDEENQQRKTGLLDDDDDEEAEKSNDNDLSI